MSAPSQKNEIMTERNQQVLMRDIQSKPSWKTSKAGGGGGLHTLPTTSTVQQTTKQHHSKGKTLLDHSSREMTVLQIPDANQPINYSTAQTFLHYNSSNRDKYPHLSSMIPATIRAQHAAESMLTQIELNESIVNDLSVKKKKTGKKADRKSDKQPSNNQRSAPDPVAVPGCSTSVKPVLPPTTSAQGKFHDFSIEYILSQNMWIFIIIFSI